MTMEQWQRYEATWSLPKPQRDGRCLRTRGFFGQVGELLQ